MNDPGHRLALLIGQELHRRITSGREEPERVLDARRATLLSPLAGLRALFGSPARAHELGLSPFWLVVARAAGLTLTLPDGRTALTDLGAMWLAGPPTDDHPATWGVSGPTRSARCSARRRPAGES